MKLPHPIFLSPLTHLTLMSLVALVSFGTFLSGCQSVDVNFEEGINPEVYFHRAQLAVDLKDYETALAVYKKFMETNPTDMGILVSAEYEIGFLNYKLGLTSEAVSWMKKVAARYEDPAQVATLPTWPRALASKILLKIEPQKDLAVTTAPESAAAANP